MILSKNGVLYTQIKDELIERIKKDVYPLNTLLPTETQLVEEFNVSKITVRKAIELLSQEGWVEKKAGKGTT
ncbi:MAG: GntR family transcriptional regulator, partial [Cetobacterium somerae]